MPRMIEDGEPRAPVVFGDGALRFVDEELRSAADEFDGLFARRLLALELEAPFAFLAAAPRPSARPFRDGGVDGGRADDAFAEAVSRWLRQPDDHDRLVVLEEWMARRSDPARFTDVLYLGDRIYHVADATADAGDVARICRRVSGYPGIGALVRAPTRDGRSLELAASDLDDFGTGTVTALLRAWDDEAFLLAPVKGKLTPADLR